MGDRLVELHKGNILEGKVTENRFSSLKLNYSISLVI